MRRVLTLIDRVNTWIGKAVSVLILFVALAITYEIVMRYFFSRPTVWAAESTAFACGIVYLLGGAWTLLEDKHVRIDMLYSRLTGRRRALLDCCTYFFFSLYVVVMLWATAVYTFESLQVLETTMTPWDPPIYPMKVTMTLALLLVFLQGTVKFIRDLYVVIKGEPQ